MHSDLVRLEHDDMLLASRGRESFVTGMEGKRMASGIIGNDVPRKGLRVRVPCPPLPKPVFSLAFFVFPCDLQRFLPVGSAQCSRLLRRKLRRIWSLMRRILRRISLRQSLAQNRNQSQAGSSSSRLPPCSPTRSKQRESGSPFLVLFADWLALNGIIASRVVFLPCAIS